MRAKNLQKTLEFSLKNNFSILIKGQPGIGKSEIVEQACKSLDYELIISHPVVSDPTDYKGLPFVVDGKARFYPFGDLERLLKAEKPIVFFLEDLGQSTPAVQSALMQLLLAGQINGHKISNEVRFVAATNRREDRANVSGILEPVKSRFYSIVELEINSNDWIEWAWKNEIPNQLISFIQFKPGKLNEFKASRDIENSPCPRTIAFIGKMIKKGIPDEIQFEMYKGAAGESFAVEFMAFLKVFMMLPTITEIENNPEGAKLPDEASSRFAVMGMIVDKMSDKNIGALQTYLKRLGDEMLTAAMVNASKRHPELLNTSEFTNWAIQNGQEIANMI